MNKYQVVATIWGDNPKEIVEKLRAMADNISQVSQNYKCDVPAGYEYGVYYQGTGQLVVQEEWENYKDDLSEVHELVGQRKLIPALKLYRELTGVGFKEAKDYIDSIR